MSADSAAATISRGSALRYPVEVGSFDPVLQHSIQLERKRGASTPDHKAPQAARIQGCGEERGPGADVGADDVRVVELERVRETDDELAHRTRRQQLVAALGMTEPRQVDRHQMCLLGEAQPCRLECEQALRPGAQQENMILAVIALGDTDRQPVDRPEPRLD